MTNKMKGEFPEELVWTSVVLLTVVILSIVGILALLNAFLFQGKSSLSSTIDFIVLTNRPYSLATGLTYFRIEDRNFLEHVVETSYSSLDEAKSQGITKSLSEFFDKYELSFYNLRITEGEETRFDLLSQESGSAVGRVCGDSLEGACVFYDSFRPTDPVSGVCGVGRVEISEGRNKCDPGLAEKAFGAVACCMFSPDEFEKQKPSIKVQKCGQNSEGICNNDAILVGADGSPSFIPNCREGTVDKVGEAACHDINNKQTPTCCLYQNRARKRLVATGLLSTAQIPLLYKDSFGYAEVTIK